MTTIEDQLRELMAERTAAPRLDGEPYAHVERRIGRIRRRRAAGAGAALAAVAVGVAALVLPGGRGDTPPATPRPEPSAGTVLATITAGPAQATGTARSRPSGRASVPVPAGGLTIRVDCEPPGNFDQGVVVRVAGRWFTGVDCGRPGVRSTVFALPAADYPRYGLRPGTRAAVLVNSDELAHRWVVRVAAGLPPVAAEPAPQPATPPSITDPFGYPTLTTVAATRGRTNGVFQAQSTVPEGAFTVYSACTGGGSLTVTVLGPHGNHLGGGPLTCAVLARSGIGATFDRTTLRGLGVAPGSQVSLLVQAEGFDRPTWRVSLTAGPSGTPSPPSD